MKPGDSSEPTTPPAKPTARGMVAGTLLLSGVVLGALAGGLLVAGMMGRAWVVGLAVVAAGVIGDKDDAICAAVVALVAFTVYLPVSLIIRQLERNAVRP